MSIDNLKKSINSYDLLRFKNPHLQKTTFAEQRGFTIRGG